MSVVVPVLSLAAAASAAYAGHAVLARHNGDVQAWLVRFLTGPGRTSRLLLLLFMALNVKSLPFVWTARIFGAMIRHTLWPRKPLPQRALFHYSITRSRTSLMETDYNFHKSNSTYFADLDASRTHLVMYLLGPGVAALGQNAKNKIVMSPETGRAMPGSLGVGLGAVFCSFRKEIAPYQPYEMWSRVLAWDRKWLYVMTHFVVKGKVKPASFDGSGKPEPAAREWTAADEANLQKHVIATAISKYVFKLGRFTVHPTFLMEHSGLLPERPGESWRGGGPEAVGTMADLDDDEAGEDDEAEGVSVSAEASDAWTWKNVERERRRGMALASQFAALDDAGELFNGGKNGALGIFGPG
ncbi:hypothetical protein SCUCBS95973_001453 [Sporothrix curviconia]|uniref:Capsule polysaccharide biosynthesis protein n=1 Tax=Sporothrix curviconia TaxID=1260050 RepID=A0ABP0AYU2_9PEZI